MSRHPRKIDRVAAERLLRGEPAYLRHPDDLLAVLLATAAAPAHVGELAGEEAAVAAFRQARAAATGCATRLGDEVSIPQEQPWEPVPVRKWIRHPVRLAFVALTATTAGGVALAAGSVPWSRQPSDQRPATASPSPSQLARPGSGQGLGTANATPHPSLVGLCRAYKAGAGTAPGRALDSPAFGSLIGAAGGKDKVPAYCADVLANEARRAKRSRPTGHATSPGRPGEAGQSGHNGPTGRPPAGRSTVLPTKAIPQRTKTPGTHLLSAQIAGGRPAPPPWSPPAGYTGLMPWPPASGRSAPVPTTRRISRPARDSACRLGRTTRTSRRGPGFQGFT